MSANNILLWMSARGEGSWQQFRGAVEELQLIDGREGSTNNPDDNADPFALPSYQLLRLNLQRLGHAEFFYGAGTRDWRVAPPTIAATQCGSDWIGVFAGARSRRLLRQLYEVAQPLAIDVTPSENAPDTIRIVAKNPSALQHVAAKSGLFLQPDAPPAILSATPSIDDATVRKKSELPFGSDWDVEEFFTPELRWRPTTRNAPDRASFGLFRFTLRHQRFVFLCSEGVAFDVPIQVGKYLLFKRRRHRVVQYDPARQELSVPAVCRPPLLVERALILCSGLLPSENTEQQPARMLTYSHVPPSVARLASALLEQKIM